jgi:Uma2 family endonuclease
MDALRNMTAQELFYYKHEPFRTELIAGRLVEMEPTGGTHGVVAAQSCWLLSAHVLPRGLGKVFGAETGFVLETDPDTVRAPDASFLSRERIQALGGVPATYIPGAPDLAFEVTSPNDRRTEVVSKAQSWLRAGTTVVVVVDPRRRTATVYRLDAPAVAYGDSESLVLEDILPGFSLALADILD